jgi:hypothetical protein
LSLNSAQPLDFNKEHMTNDEMSRVVKQATKTIGAQQELIDLLYGQVVDLSMMSKIELGDDVIEEIRRLKGIINE